VALPISFQNTAREKKNLIAIRYQERVIKNIIPGVIFRLPKKPESPSVHISFTFRADW